VAAELAADPGLDVGVAHERGERGEARVAGPLEAGVEQAERAAAQDEVAARVVDDEVGPLAGLDHGGAELVVAEADRHLLGAVAAAELDEILDDGLGLVGGAVGDDELAVGDVDDAAGPEGALEAAIGVEAGHEGVRGVDEGDGAVAVGADDGPLDAREVDDADEHELALGVDRDVGVDEAGDGEAAALVRVDAVAAAQALAVALLERSRTAQRWASRSMSMRAATWATSRRLRRSPASSSTIAAILPASSCHAGQSCGSGRVGRSAAICSALASRSTCIHASEHSSAEAVSGVRGTS
jgi:hypothetical protein